MPVGIEFAGIADHVQGWGFPYAISQLGFTMVMPGPYGKQHMPTIIKKIVTYQPTFSHGVPLIVEALINCSTRRQTPWKFIVGGERCSQEIIDNGAQKNILCKRGYGLTETYPFITVMTSKDTDVPGEAVGRVDREDIHVKIVKSDNKDQEIALEDGEHGEVIVNLPWLFNGYLGKPDATKAVLKEGWFRTGDIGYISEYNGHSYLYLTDRIKYTAKFKGEYADNPTLEGALKEANIFGPKRTIIALPLPARDPINGTQPAIVVVDAEASPTLAVVNEKLAQLKEENIISVTESEIRYIMHITEAELRKHIGTTGKIEKQGLLEKLQEEFKQHTESAMFP